MTYREAHPNFVTSYMDREKASAHAFEIGGWFASMWAGGVQTYGVFQGPRGIWALDGHA